MNIFPHTVQLFVKEEEHSSPGHSVQLPLLQPRKVMRGRVISFLTEKKWIHYLSFCFYSSLTCYMVYKDYTKNYVHGSMLWNINFKYNGQKEHLFYFVQACKNNVHNIRMQKCSWLSHTFGWLVCAKVKELLLTLVLINIISTITNHFALL